VSVKPLAERTSGTAVIDASVLPSYRFGHQSMMWWGTLGMIAIEGTVFALAAFTYFYVRTRVDVWPPSALPPDLTWGTLNLIVMLASLVPNYWTKKMAEKEDVPNIRKGMAICVTFAVIFVLGRIMEYRSLNVGWDTNAYGSAVWVLLSLHTIHLLTDLFDTVVLLVLMHSGPLEGKRFVDVSENCYYWYFVVIAWVPIYLIIYIAPRVL
jgi:heme/copper-type cytochrome/quinol oxidase subunit 3